MLHLYSKEGVKLLPLTKYKDFYIERGLKGLENICFKNPIIDENSPFIETEGYIRTQENEYVIKEKNTDGDYLEIFGEVNVEALKGKRIDYYSVVNQRIDEHLNTFLTGTGWTISLHVAPTVRRTIRKYNTNAYDLIQDALKVFRNEVTFDAINKIIHVYFRRGGDKGTYFSDKLNLKRLNIQENTHEYITRLIPIGADGLKISAVNSGKDYVENYQYSNKILYAFWEDTRYTDALSIKEDAEFKLDEISKPYIAYSVDVYDLSKQSGYDFLSFTLGDSITILNRLTNTKVKQRIVKMTTYPEEPEKNSCEIANSLMNFAEHQAEIQAITDTANRVLNDSGNVDGNKIDDLTVPESETTRIVAQSVNATDGRFSALETNKANITDLSAAVGRIGTLETTRATITDLTAATGRISTLETNKANITDLTASNGRIDTLETNVANIQNIFVGNITADMLKANTITASSGVISNGAIGNAMISNLDVSKLNSGTINTALINLSGTNGKLKIVGDRLQVIDGNNKERVSIGDVNANGTVYGLRIRGADGVTVLIDETGVKNEGITPGAVDDSKISENANIQGNKIDVDSVVVEINTNGLEKIQGSKVVVNNVDLTTKFYNIETTQTSQGTTISQQQTAISQNASAISTKVEIQTYNTDIGGINSTLSSHSTSISQLNSSISLKANATDVYTKAQTDSAINNLRTMAKLNGTELLNLSYQKDLTALNKTFLSTTGTVSLTVATEIGGNANESNIIKCINGSYMYTPFIACNPSGTHYVRMSVYNQATNTGTVYAQVCYYDKDKVPVATNEGAMSLITAKANTSADVWETHEGYLDAIAPTDVRQKAVFMRIRFLARYSNQTGVTYLKDLSWKQLAPQSIADFESRVSNAELKITPSAITQTVQNERAAKIFKVRYIRDYLNGNSVNTGNHWVEIQALNNKGENVALNKPVTSNSGLTTNIETLTDGNKYTDPYYSGGINLYYVQIDLGQVYQNIDNIIVWHYWGDGRTYYNNKTQISEDGVNWITIFDSATEGNYAEQKNGHSIKVNESASIRTGIGSFTDEGFEMRHSDVGTSTKMAADGFKIYNSLDEEIGSLATESGLSILNADLIYANNLITTSYNTSNAIFHVNGSTGNDDNDGSTSSVPKKTIMSVLNSMPKIKMGGELQIYVEGTLYENVSVSNFWWNGAIVITFGSTAKLYGGIRITNCNCRVIIGGNKTTVTTTDGAVISNSKNADAYDYPIYIMDSKFVSIGSINIHTAKGLENIMCFGGPVFLSAIDFYGLDTALDKSMIVAVNGANVHFINCVGNGKYVARAWNNAIVSYNGGTYIPLGTNGTYSQWGASQMFASGTVTATASKMVAPPTPPTSVYSKTWATTSADSWRDSGWRSDNNYIYQGEYGGYGNHKGFMIFNASDIRANLSGATIVECKLTLTRRSSGGSSAAQTVHLWGHQYTATGGGTTLNKDYGNIGSLAWGETKTLNIPVSVANDLKASTIQGLALYEADGSPYVICEGSASLYIKYEK